MRSILVGIIISDGWIQVRNGWNPRVGIKQSMKNFNYFWTDNFTMKEVVQLINMQIIKFNISPTMHTEKNKSSIELILIKRILILLDHLYFHILWIEVLRTLNYISDVKHLTKGKVLILS